MRVFGRRFAVEVGFIVLVAVVLAVTHLRWPVIVGLMGAAWVVTALIEFVAWRRGREWAPEPLERPAALLESSATESALHLRVLGPPPDWPREGELKQEPEPGPGPEPASAPLGPQADSEPEPELEPIAVKTEPEPELEPVAVEPEPEPVAIEAEPEPEPEPGAVEREPQPELEPVAAQAEPDLEPVAAAAEAEPEPELEPEPVPAEAEPVAQPVAAEADPEPKPEPVALERVPKPEPLAAEPALVEREPTAARAWNIWELDNLAKDAAEEHREELSYLLVYLRDFASTEGVLPTDFDALVRESFGDLLAAGAL